MTAAIGLSLVEKLAGVRENLSLTNALQSLKDYPKISAQSASEKLST
jgi:hypothetical protein